jgi:hypothetical protein
MKKLFTLSLFLAVCSCATVFNSGSQTMIANPSNVDAEGVVVDVTTSSGSYKTKLPATIISAPSTFSDVKIRVSDKCYENAEVKVRTGITPSYWVNILIWPGLIIDALDGYMWKFDSQTMVPTTKLDKCGK